jgi:hypothetical protein
VLLNGGGFLKIYTGTQPALNGAVTGTLLATLTFATTAFATATAAGGTVTATANAIGSGTAAATGTAGYFALLKSDGITIVATGSVAATGGTADLILNSLSISSGANVSCSAFTFTQPES